MTTAIVTLNESDNALTFKSEFQSQLDTALGEAGLIARVSDEIQNANLTTAQKLLKTCLDMVEAARTEAKRPFLEGGRRVDAFFSPAETQLRSELRRLGQVGGDWIALVDKRKRAEELKRRQEQDEIDRRAQEQIAKAQTIEQVEEIRANAAQEQMALAPVIAAPKPKGQVVLEDWEIEVEGNGLLLAVSHPDCVRIEPKLGQIKALLRAGAEVKGVRARSVKATTVRSSRKEVAV